jgi:hypothetical protein
MKKDSLIIIKSGTIYIEKDRCDLLYDILQFYFKKKELYLLGIA